MNAPGARILIPSVYATSIALIVAAANLGLLNRFTTFIHATPGTDKLLHFALVGGLAFAINHATRCRTLPILHRPILIGAAICLPLSIIEELSQSLIPTRTFDPADLLANVLGILIIGPLARRLNPVAPAAC
jgi:hypothetical protein